MPRLGLDFLRRRGPRANASELPVWFENLLPERDSALRVRLAAAFGLREGQSFALLRCVGRDLLGAVETRTPDGGHSDGAPDEPVDSKAAEPDPQVLAARHSALTGMQIKFSMSMVNDRLTLSARGGGSAWIVKLTGTEYPELAEVERATMTWARQCGFDVPDLRVVAFETLEGIPSGWPETAAPAYAVRRFDRRDDGTKVHQEDLCQALDVRPLNKYGTENPRIAFEGVLRLIHDTCGETDARELARRLGFMLVSGNTDAHLKNWALLWGDRSQPTLAPCYDLVATIAWDRLGWMRPRGPLLALRLGGASHFAQIDRRRIEAFATRAGLTWAAEEVCEGVLRGLRTWSRVCDEAPIRMRDALATHWDEVPIVRELRATA